MQPAIPVEWRAAEVKVHITKETIDGALDGRSSSWTKVTVGQPDIDIGGCMGKLLLKLQPISDAPNTFRKVPVGLPSWPL